MGFSLKKYIDIKYFLISLAIGLFFVYITFDENRKITVYPSPENADLIQYRDKADQCFEFQETPVQCPDKKEKMFKVPVQ
jgi:hypothetical protein